jgi:protease I
MPSKLFNTRVAAIVTDGFEQSELFEPKKALEEAGAAVDVISIKTGDVKAWNHKEWGESAKATKAIADVSADDYDALLLPGGVMNPDKLRTNGPVVAFVREMWTAKKPIAAICHGPWTLIEAGAVDGRTLTSWPSLKTDLINAGANWVDEAVVVDQGLVTSRKPDDIPAFNAKMIEEFAEGPHQRR